MRTALYEHGLYRPFLPLTWTRHLAELRSGAYTYRERVERLAGGPVALLSDRDYLAETSEPLGGHTLYLKASAVVGSLPELPPRTLVVDARNEVVGVCLESPPQDYSDDGLRSLATATETVQFGFDRGWYEVPPKLRERLAEDLSQCEGSPLEGGTGQVVAQGKVVVGRNVVVDGSQGPVLIGEGARLHHNCVVVGPCYIGPRTEIMSHAFVDSCAFGRECRVGGEVGNTVFQAFTNKRHGGHLGHSFLGEWVNIGAESTFSNLKNTYGTVRLKTPYGELDTGQTFLGCALGDHTRCAVGTRFNCGSVVGVFAMLFGDIAVSGFVPSFSYGTEGMTALRLESAARTAVKVMNRRNISPVEGFSNWVERLYELTESERVVR